MSFLNSDCKAKAKGLLIICGNRYQVTDTASVNIRTRHGKNTDLGLGKFSKDYSESASVTGMTFHLNEGQTAADFPSDGCGCNFLYNAGDFVYTSDDVFVTESETNGDGVVTLSVASKIRSGADKLDGFFVLKAS